MWSKSSILFITLICISCTISHRSAKDFYESGYFYENDFHLIKKDDSLLKCYYQYKYDTALIVIQNYDNDWHVFRGNAYYYNRRPEGKWIFLEINGDTLGIVHFKNGKKNGYEYRFINKVRLPSYLYRNDTAIKAYEYYPNGRIKDSGDLNMEFPTQSELLL